MSAQRPKRPGSPVDRPAGGVYQPRSRGLRSGRSPGAPSTPTDTRAQHRPDINHNYFNTPPGPQSFARAPLDPDSRYRECHAERPGASGPTLYLYKP